ncbi:MAG: hypothetical protein GY856_04070, partial [bacterium]|nr:hypothetical protein [bacterium]
LEGWFELAGPWQSTLRVSYTRRNRFFGGRVFAESFRTLDFSIRPSGRVYFRLFVQAGDDLDLDNVDAGDQWRLEPAVELNLGRRLRAELRHIVNRLEVAGRERIAAQLTEMRLVYQFNLRSFLRLITQVSDVDRDPAFFARAREEELFNQLLFSYKLNPRTVLFAGYSDNYEGDEAIDLVQKNRTIFLKLGYAWVL